MVLRIALVICTQLLVWYFFLNFIWALSSIWNTKKLTLKYCKYLSSYLVPIAVFLSIYMGGYYSFGAIIFLFILIPFVELFTKLDTSNMTAIEEDVAKEDRIYDYLLYFLVPFQFLILIYFLYTVSTGHFETYELAEW